MDLIFNRDYVGLPEIYFIIELILCIYHDTCRMVRDGYFGHEEYFKPLCDSIESAGDFYLLGHDFPSYLEAQVS